MEASSHSALPFLLSLPFASGLSILATPRIYYLGTDFSSSTLSAVWQPPLVPPLLVT